MQLQLNFFPNSFAIKLVGIFPQGKNLLTHLLLFLRMDQYLPVVQVQVLTQTESPSESPSKYHWNIHWFFKLISWIKFSLQTLVLNLKSLSLKPKSINKNKRPSLYLYVYLSICLSVYLFVWNLQGDFLEDLSPVNLLPVIISNEIEKLAYSLGKLI